MSRSRSSISSEEEARKRHAAGQANPSGVTEPKRARRPFLNTSSWRGNPVRRVGRGRGIK